MNISKKLDGTNNDKKKTGALFSSPGQMPCELLPSLGVCLLSIKFFTFKFSNLKPLNLV
jgi:hypothetical protein